MSKAHPVHPQESPPIHHGSPKPDADRPVIASREHTVDASSSYTAWSLRLALLFLWPKKPPPVMASTKKSMEYGHAQNISKRCAYDSISCQRLRRVATLIVVQFPEQAVQLVQDVCAVDVPEALKLSTVFNLWSSPGVKGTATNLDDELA
jgi:hypothetical protein